MQLVWSEPKGPDGECPYDHCRAVTPFGVYSIEWKSWKDYPGYSAEFRDEYINTGASLDEAKTLAQSDFDCRLSQCINPNPA